MLAGRASPRGDGDGDISSVGGDLSGEYGDIPVGESRGDGDRVGYAGAGNYSAETGGDQEERGGGSPECG